MLHQNTPHAQLEAILSDLAANGVTDIVSESPQNWFAPVRPKELLKKTSSPKLRAEPKAKAAPAPKKIQPLNPENFINTHGSTAAPLTIVTAIMPEQSTAMPFNAAEERLLINMLKAINHTIEEVSFATVLATNEEGAALTKPQITELHKSAQQALANLAPKNILCFGQLAASVFISGEAMPISACRKTQPQGGKARTVTTYHPRHLLKSPQYKQLAWQDLQPFVTQSTE